MKSIGRQTALLLVDNLIFQTRIENVLEKAGFQVVIPTSLASHPYASVAIVELDEARNWRTTLTALREAHPTLPVICFGSHVNREALALAAKLGAKLVLPRSQFMAKLAELPSVIRSW